MKQGHVVATCSFSAPLYVAWETTHRCNATCKHCYSNSSPDADCAVEMSTSEGIDVIDQLANAGVLVLAFSGGEPLLRRDWEDLVSHAVARGLSVNLGTNGSSISRKTASAIQRLGVRSVTVSIDSHNAYTHDNLRQKPGLFNEAVNAVKLLAEKKIRVVIGFTPTRLNWKDGKSVIELARQIGASAVNLSEYVPAGRGDLSLALRPDELHEVLMEWIHLREVYKRDLELIWHDCRVGLLVPDSEKRNYVGCGAGRLVARICPDGTVTPCVFLSSPIGSFRTHSFQDMWSQSPLLKQFRDRTSGFNGNCADCEHLHSCGGCRAVAYAYSNGDPLAGDPHCWIKLSDQKMVADLRGGESLPI
ncbi:MAG: radical SAM protein [Gallionella sp.]|nr:radical SAM protein [Gallionella sp.]